VCNQNGRPLGRPSWFLARFGDHYGAVVTELVDGTEPPRVLSC